MKKIAATLCLLATAAVAFGQGSVTVNNAAATAFRTNTTAGGGGAGAALAAQGPWIYELLTAPSTVTNVDASLQQLLSAPWSDTGITMTNSPSFAGRFTYGTGAANPNFWPAGQTNSFIVVGWNAAAGASWSQLAGRLGGASLSGGSWSGGGLAAGMFVGASALGFRQAGGIVGGNTIPTPALFSSAADAQGNPITGTSDMFTVIPEPSSFALAGLGIAAVTIFRRRK